jgi:hypothetical protein
MTGLTKSQEVFDIRLCGYRFGFGMPRVFFPETDDALFYHFVVIVMYKWIVYHGLHCS